MSYIDLDQLSSPDLITQYVIECRGKGFFLPYSDHEIIQEWLKAAAGDADELLLVLSDVLPEYFAKRAAAGAHPPPLTGVRQRVRNRLRDIKMRRLVEHRSLD